MSDSISDNALAVVDRLIAAGFQAYIVGGAVRDMVLSVPPKDYDIATNACPEDVARIFPRIIPVGREFGVSLVPYGGDMFEVAMFRSDGVYEDGRRPVGVLPSDLEGDLKRRDFTINAMAYDPRDDSFIDPVGGMQDIAARTIRTVGNPVERFTEDRLRMLRAVRFAANLGFVIESATFHAVFVNARLVESVSRERIGEELANMFTGPHPGVALRLLDGTGLLDVVLPEVAVMKGVTQPPEYHPEGDVFEHTLAMLDLYEGGSVSLAFGILLHDAGKPSTRTVTDRIRFNRHDEAGAEIASSVMRRLRFSGDITVRVIRLVRNHMRFINVRAMKESTLRRFMAEDGFDELLELFRLDCLARGASLETYEYVVSLREKLGPVLPEPLISGQDIIDEGYKPGPTFKTILRAVSDAQMEGIVTTREDALAYVRRLYPAQCRRSCRTRKSNRQD